MHVFNTYGRVFFLDFIDRYIFTGPASQFHTWAPFSENFHIRQIYGKGVARAGLFKILGEHVDLALSIFYFREGLSKLPPDDEGRLWFRNRLAGSLLERFLEYGFIVDLDECISLYSDLHKQLLQNPIDGHVLKKGKSPMFLGLSI